MYCKVCYNRVNINEHRRVSMRKTMRKAVKLESKVQTLASLKMCGTMDERKAAKRKLSDGMTSRNIKAQSFRSDLSDCVLR